MYSYLHSFICAEGGWGWQGAHQVFFALGPIRSYLHYWTYIPNVQ